MHCSKTAFTIAVVIGVAFAAPPSDKSEMSNEIGGGFVTKNGDSVSASWGGFQASASLADDGSAVASASGNGLGAGAGYGAGGAAAGAGVYETGAASAGYPVKPASEGYGNGGKPGNTGGSPLYHQQNGGGFFDRIFAIPINVLQSVNTYLNQKQQGPVGATQGYPVKPAAAGSGSYAGADKIPEASVGADYGHQSATGASAGTSGGASASASASTGNGKSPMMVHKNANYDEIFNIPITALRSVQNLLNG